MDTELVASMALLLTAQIGDIRYRRLIEHFGSAGKAVKAGADEFGGAAEIPESTARKVLGSLSLDRAREEIEHAQREGAEVLGIHDERYPEQLRGALGPSVLFIRGDIKSLYGPAVAIVGTRHPTPYGREQSRKIAGFLAQAGIVVVSGMAYGIDSEAHLGAVQTGGRTVAVFGCGLSNIYPKQNKGLAEKIAASGGALVSEFPMDFPIRPENFPRRNRIISGLSLGTFVVEAARRSGALITASFSAEQGREIFALPGPVTSLQSMGTNALIQDGAKLVTCVEDILNELRLDLLPFARKGNENQEKSDAEIPPPCEVDETARKILSALDGSTTDAETISRQTGIDPDKVAIALSMLELKGAVKRVPGGYQTCDV